MGRHQLKSIIIALPQRAMAVKRALESGLPILGTIVSGGFSDAHQRYYSDGFRIHTTKEQWSYSTMHRFQRSLTTNHTALVYRAKPAVLGPSTRGVACIGMAGLERLTILGEDRHCFCLPYQRGKGESIHDGCGDMKGHGWALSFAPRTIGVVLLAMAEKIVRGDLGTYASETDGPAKVI
jgi:hypothetical protein